LKLSLSTYCDRSDIVLRAISVTVEVNCLRISSWIWLAPASVRRGAMGFAFSFM